MLGWRVDISAGGVVDNSPHIERACGSALPYDLTLEVPLPADLTDVDEGGETGFINLRFGVKVRGGARSLSRWLARSLSLPCSAMWCRSVDLTDRAALGTALLSRSACPRAAADIPQLLPGLRECCTIHRMAAPAPSASPPLSPTAWTVQSYLPLFDLTGRGLARVGGLALCPRRLCTLTHFTRAPL